MLKGSLPGSLQGSVNVRTQGGGVLEFLVELRPVYVCVCEGEPMGKSSCQLNSIETDARAQDNLLKVNNIALKISLNCKFPC